VTGTFATAGWVVAGGSFTGGADAVGVGVTDALADVETDGLGATEGVVERVGSATAPGAGPGVDDRLLRKRSNTMTTMTDATAPSGGSSRRSVAATGSPAR